MRFRTRAFLVCFVPFALLLAGSFWMIQHSVQSAVRGGLRTSLRENQLAINRVHSRSDLQNSRFLKIAGENAALKAGLQLLVSEHGNDRARATVEDQLVELGEHMNFDFLLVSGPNGKPLAGVARTAAGSDGKRLLAPLQEFPSLTNSGFVLMDNRPLQTGSATLDIDRENLGSITVGEELDLSEFATPTVLLHNGQVIQSNVEKVPLAEINAALRSCKEQAECDFHLSGTDWVSLPMQDVSGNGEYILRSLGNVDAAMAPINVVLQRLFFTVSLGSVLVAFLCSMASSRSIVKPIATVVARLRQTARTGMLPEFASDLSPIVEIRELAESYNRAAASVRSAQDKLQGAYVEFVGSLAQALDARDRYTAGHSQRVSDIACSIASAMELDAEKIELLRVGALLHDIGKIGVSDTVLQKPGRLTDEEFGLVKEHPVIGRHILEGVQGFAPYLHAVELHHENWDGTGYPKKQKGEETPVEARIIHVADAYDAMTTNRSYRQGMTHDRAMEILREHAGTQFDPHVVATFEKTFVIPSDADIEAVGGPVLLVATQQVVEA
ncbi:MAG TPA: HD-GYP domain-containing protein [Acidobacteriaceae bacterium]